MPCNQLPCTTIRNAPNLMQCYWGSAALTVPSQGTATILLRDAGCQRSVCHAIFKALTILQSAKDSVYTLHYTLTTFQFVLPRESRVKKTPKHEKTAQYRAKMHICEIKLMYTGILMETWRC